MQVSLCLYYIFNIEIIFEIGDEGVMVIYSLSNPNEGKWAAYRRNQPVLTDFSPFWVGPHTSV